MTNLDDRLRAGLSADDEAFLKTLEDRGMFAQMGATLQGPMKGWTMLAFVFSFVFFLLFLFCFWRGYGAADVRDTVLWCAGSLWLALSVAMLKLWMWERMNHLAVLRELKKIELRVAQLQDAR